MRREQCWRVIAEQRRGLADLLAGLRPEEWEAPSLCDGWRVRDVAAHLSLGACPPAPGTMLRSAVRSRGRYHRLVHDGAVRHAQRSPERLVAELREHAESRRLPFPVVVDHQVVLLDVLVHGQDIAIPLGLRREVPLDAAAVACTKVWTMTWPFWARRRLRGLRLRATDVEWTVGAGALVEGPIAALLLVLTGRRAALRSLTGPGVELLRARFAG